jgi:hypothetical protein
MDTILRVLSAAVVPVFVFLWIGGPIVMTDWLRKRRQETTMRQIALTDAIDGQLGSIVSPFVKKPLWGPWQIEIAVPFTRPAEVGRILAVAHDVLTGAEGINPGRYRIVLTPKQDPIREERKFRASQSAERWSRDSRVAA